MRYVALLLVLFFLPFAAHAKTPRVPILLDTDIGDDIDDAFALALALKHPQLDLRGVTTVAGPIDAMRVQDAKSRELLKAHKSGDAFSRALLVCRFLAEVRRDDVPVASGSPAWEPPVRWTGQMSYGVGAEVRKRPVAQTAVEFLYRQLKARPGEQALVAIGPLTNVANLLREHPDCKPWIKRIAIMGGSIRVGYADKPPVDAEWNIKSDVAAARIVFQAGVPLTVAPLDATTSLKLEAPLRRRLFATATPYTRQLDALYRLWGPPTPTLFDPAAVALCTGESCFTMEDLHVEIDDAGFTRVLAGAKRPRGDRRKEGRILEVVRGPGAVTAFEAIACNTEWHAALASIQCTSFQRAIASRLDELISNSQNGHSFMSSPIDPIPGKSGLGSLAQAARKKQLGQARGILIGIGILTIVVNGIMLAMIRDQVKKQIETEVRNLPPGMVADPVKIHELEEQAVRTASVVAWAVIALGVLFIVLGLIVHRYPVPVTILSLVLYIGSAAVFGVLDPATLARGIVVKVIIVVALIKAVQAAIASQKEEPSLELPTPQS